MPPSTDPHITVARLQQEISQKLNLNLEHLIFNYTALPEGVRLELITVNPKHDQSFLYHSTEAPSKEEALRRMSDYVIKNNQAKNSFTVQWTQKGIGELHTSYFRARDIYEVLEKFYHGQEKGDFTIFSITLNPIA